MSSNHSHDEIELRIAEALTGEAALDDRARAHLANCERCTALADALGAIARDADGDAPDAAYWDRFSRSLDARLNGEIAARARTSGGRGSSRWLRVALPIAASLAGIALALWGVRALRPATPPVVVETQPVNREVLLPQPGGTTTEVAPGDDVESLTPAAADAVAPAVLAAASESSLDAGLLALGLSTSWTDDTDAEGEAETGPDAPLEPASAARPAPAWGDVLGELEEELATLDLARQAGLARTLREAT